MFEIYFVIQAKAVNKANLTHTHTKKIIVKMGRHGTQSPQWTLSPPPPNNFCDSLGLLGLPRECVYVFFFFCFFVFETLVTIVGTRGCVPLGREGDTGFIAMRLVRLLYCVFFFFSFFFLPSTNTRQSAGSVFDTS